MNKTKILYQYNFWLFLVLSSYIFGIICIQWAYLPSLVNFSWFQMLLCLGAILFTASDTDYKRRKYLLIAWLVGFLIEVLGVNTGLIFGNYYYGSALGLKVFNTPLMIGVNWFLLCYTVNQITEKIFRRSLINILLSATIITAFDSIIEPDAMRLGMWSWLNNVVPLQNYIAWWITALFLSAIYYYMKISFQSMSYWILGAMLVFFLSA